MAVQIAGNDGPRVERRMSALKIAVRKFQVGIDGYGSEAIQVFKEPVGGVEIVALTQAAVPAWRESLPFPRT